MSTSTAAKPVIVITGASDGIGAVAARQLHEQGAAVVVVGRSPEKTKRVAHKISAPHYIADFAKLDDVRSLAVRLKQDFSQIDVLINNAGGIFGKRELTVDGHEKTMQVNHLAHFLLTTLLMSTLLSSKAIVINTSSIANWRFGNLDIDDIELAHGFSPNRAYGNAKLANILFTRELHSRYHKQGLSAVAVHPGVIATNFASDTTSLMRFAYRSVIAKWFFETAEQGAEPLVWLATALPGSDWESGGYYEKYKPGKLNQQANDAALSRKLWDISDEFTRRMQ